MKKLLFLGTIIMLVACGNATVTTTQTTTIETTTVAPIIKNVTYSLTQAIKEDDSKTEVHLQAKNDILVKVAMVVRIDNKDDADELSETQKAAVVKLSKEQLIKEDPIFSIDQLEGGLVTAELIKNEVVVSVGIDLEKMDKLKFKELVGEDVFSFIFSPAYAQKTQLTLEQAETALIAQGGKKIDVN